MVKLDQTKFRAVAFIRLPCGVPSQSSRLFPVSDVTIRPASGVQAPYVGSGSFRRFDVSPRFDERLFPLKLLLVGGFLSIAVGSISHLKSKARLVTVMA